MRTCEVRVNKLNLKVTIPAKLSLILLELGSLMDVKCHLRELSQITVQVIRNHRLYLENVSQLGSGHLLHVTKIINL